MKASIRLICVAALIGSASAVSEGQQNPRAAYTEQLQTSSLRQQAIAAGGNLMQVRTASAANLSSDMSSLMSRSNEVLLVHILKAAAQLSPSGRDPITIYQASVIKRWKGKGGRDKIAFSVPIGKITFDSSTSAYTRIKGFKPLLVGARYVVFLRFAQGTERDLTPAFRLAGDATQGAFEIVGERVFPSYSADQIASLYWGKPAAGFLTEMDSLASAQPGPQFATSAAVGQPQAPVSPYHLTADQLQNAGFHMPTYMANVTDLMRYQDKTPTHQELTVEWDSIPGQQEPMLKQQAAQFTPAPNFVVTDRKQHLAGAAGKSPSSLTEDELVIVAVTATGEVRGISVQWDSRIVMAESMNSAQPQSAAIVFPKVTLAVRLPDDFLIAKAVFLKPAFDSASMTWQLQPLGAVDLKATATTP